MTEVKLSATVILYNPEDEIYENIKSYIDYVDKLYIVDNSTKYNENLISKLKKNYENIEYINNDGNLGIATALNIACDKAINDEFEWILTMDQDSKFLNFKHYKDCFLTLEDTSNIALLAANTDFGSEDIFPTKPSCESKDVFSVITSANILNLKLFNKIGRFEDKLFIDVVDFDYCVRAQINNFKILSFKDAIVAHNLGTLFERKNILTGKIRKKREHNSQRVYYFARNYLYMARQYAKYYPKKLGMLKILNILFIHEVTKIILYEDNKLAKITAKIRGLYHFIIGKYGKFDI